ncbi:hypothetical protein BpHYR1_039586 [Brachionus plicatilis]|uniref:Uncharacterized protein n=1 Tax=Brachionus plicatilis TaxID=10195 RepID=A0A3M7QMZ7_BRAPC|nr:hypothetical protein BpHYR1_039586 [Brachionus plicatilis]
MHIKLGYIEVWLAEKKWISNDIKEFLTHPYRIPLFSDACFNTMEKEAIEKPICNKSTTEKVKKTLSNKRSSVKCPECDNYFERRELKIHMTRKH